METNLLNTLHEYGLSDKESKVYLSLLELGRAGAGTLSRTTGIKRVTIYALVKSMIEKGVVKVLEKKSTNMYIPVSPNRLFLKKKQELEQFEQALPNFLNVIDKRGNRPQIEYFDGVSGIKRMYDNLLLFKQPLYAFLSDDSIHEDLHQYLNFEFIEKRRKKQIHASVLVNKSEVNEVYEKQVEKDPLTSMKLVEESFEGLQGEIILYGEHNVMFALYSPDELVGYIIESKQLYTSMMTLFNFVWKHS